MNEGQTIQGYTFRELLMGKCAVLSIVGERNC